MKRIIIVLALIALMVTNVQAFRVTTADGSGADVELREINPDTNRGDNSEIASRVSSGHNSVVYLKFDVATMTAADLAGDITVRTTYRNTNLSEGRIYDAVNDAYATWDYYVMDPATTGADWDEATITPNTAPAFYVDGDMATKGIYDMFGFLNLNLTALGSKSYDPAELVGGHLPVGGAFDFTLGAGSALHNAIDAAQGTANETVTVVMTISHDYTDDVPGDWINFNYLFNPKEKTTLEDDATSPWYGLDNTNNDFSPMLTNEPHIVPEPATLALLGLGGLLLRRKR